MGAGGEVAPFPGIGGLPGSPAEVVSYTETGRPGMVLKILVFLNFMPSK